MTASRRSLRAAAAATFCSPESRPTWVCVRECTSGSAWIGMLRLRPAPCSCLSAVTSVSELLVSFGCTSDEWRNDEHKKTRVAIFARLRVCAGFARTDQAHRNARRRHDVKLLSLRGEA